LSKEIEVAMPGNLKAALFDLDGVVVDTAKYHYLAWKKLAEELGSDLTIEENNLFKGVGRMQCMDILLSLKGLSMTEEEKLKNADRKNKIYIEYISKMSKDEVLPGFLKLSDEIKKRGWKIALASSSKNTAIVLERLGISNCFDAIVNGNDIVNSKPHPEIFEKAAQKVGINPSECVVFEDAKAGVQAAKAAGMKCVGIGKREELNRADMVIPGFEGISIEDILEVIEGGNK
jgi:beta-phosphoglucomutase